MDRLMRTGGTAALQFGQAVTGVSSSMLLQQRRSVAASVVSTSGGGSLDITLLLADGGLRGRADPAFAAHIEPIYHWALAVWESWLLMRAMQRLLREAQTRLGAARNLCAVVRGPASAFVATAARLRWVVHDAVAVTTDSGVALAFSMDSPAFVKEAVAGCGSTPWYT